MLEIFLFYVKKNLNLARIIWFELQGHFKESESFVHCVWDDNQNQNQQSYLFIRYKI